MLVRNPPQQSFDALPLLAAPEYHPLAIFRALLNHLFPKYHLNCNPRIWYEKLLIDAIMICRVLYFFGQLFSIIFPFLHFIIYRGHQNLLQCFCFYGAAGTMFVIICLAPRIYRFVLFGLFHLPQAMLAFQQGWLPDNCGPHRRLFHPPASALHRNLSRLLNCSLRTSWASSPLSCGGRTLICERILLLIVTTCRTT
ncbi:transmembrane protein, putative [Bodo saltans]|uniref:Transmembrane protein, putative n=1 Tax=Bodo saltans TaxID=75058 RepID=A0A0S4IX02_BODSA|nr:transmembrane protein, putative [Bodo saltans]|eukprot:CUG06504.1 transmembrane protein, putative [Bodo saltans]